MSKLIAQALALLQKEDEGASLVEYALLLGLIAMACFAAMTLLGTTIGNFFGNFAGTIDSISGS